MQRPDQNQYDELVRLTRLMRESQQKFFKGDKKWMVTAKQLEKAVDTLLLQFPDPEQPMTGTQIGLSFS